MVWLVLRRSARRIWPWLILTLWCSDAVTSQGLSPKPKFGQPLGHCRRIAWVCHDFSPSSK